MKTFTNTLMMAAMACVGATATANAAGPNDFGASPNGFGGTTAGCPGGNCPTGTCRNGECGHAGCANGVCGTQPGYGQYGVNDRSGYAKPMPGRTAVAGYAPVRNAYGSQQYYGSRASMNCPGGVCPQAPSQTYMTGYRPQVPAAACTTGNCPPTASRYPTYQQPRFSFLGLRW